MTCWHERTADWSEGGRREESKRIIYMKHFLFHWCSVPGKGIDSANGHGICRIFSMGGSFAEVPQILLCAFNLLSGAITNNLKLYYISPIHACDFLGSGRMPVFTVIPHSPLQYPDPNPLCFCMQPAVSRNPGTISMATQGPPSRRFCHTCSH